MTIEEETDNDDRPELEREIEAGAGVRTVGPENPDDDCGVPADENPDDEESPESVRDIKGSDRLMFGVPAATTGRLTTGPSCCATAWAMARICC